MFAELADSTYFNDKIDLFVALAPIVYMGHVPENILQNVAPAWATLYASLKTLGLYEVNDSALYHFKVFCSQQKELCNFIGKFIKGDS